MITTTIRRFFLAAAVGLLVAGCGPRETFQRDREEFRSMARAELARDGIDASALDEEATREQTAPQLTGRSTVSDYLAYAALNSQQLEGAFQSWQAAVEQVPQVSALPDPRFTYTYFISEVETRVGAQRQAFALAQTFPWFGKLSLREDAAALAAEAEYQAYQAEKLKLFHRVRRTYYEYIYVHHAIDVVSENMRLIRHMESVARARYRAAAANHPDVIRAQVELGKLEDRLESLRELLKPIAADLNAALNRPVDTELPAPPEQKDRLLATEPETLQKWLAESNPKLRAMRARIAQADKAVELAKKAYYPDVTLGMNYIDTAASTGGRNPSDDGKDPIGATVSVNLPIWRDKLNAGLRQSKRRRWAAALARSQEKQDLTARLKRVLYEYQDAVRKVKLYRNTLLPQARQSLRVTEASFRAGNVTFLELIDAQRVLLDFQLSEERAAANVAQKLSELEMLVGRDLPRTELTPTTQPTTRKTTNE